MTTENIEKALILLDNDRLRVENLLLSAGIKPKELKEIDYVFSSSDAYNTESKKALIKFLETKKELMIAMDEYVKYVKTITAK